MSVWDLLQFSLPHDVIRYSHYIGDLEASISTSLSLPEISAGKVTDTYVASLLRKQAMVQIYHRVLADLLLV